MSFDLLEIRGQTLLSRVAAAPVTTFSYNENGSPEEKALVFYKEVVDSSPGLAVIEGHAVHAWGRHLMTQPRLDSDAAAHALIPIVDMFAKQYIPVLAQLSFAGSRISDSLLLAQDDFRLLSASTIANPNCKLECLPEMLNLEEIEAIIEYFVQAAQRAVNISGYTGVQIHACHGYLIGQFLSRLTNKRSDTWGGSVKKRARLLFSVVDAIRSSLPDSAWVTVRLGVADHMPDEPISGLSVEDTLPVARELVALGVDCIHVSGNHCRFGEDKARKGAFFAPFAKAIKDGIRANVPVECTGGIRTPQLAAQLIERGICDCVGVGRPLLKEPCFLKKWFKD